jgi:Ca2+-binding RTX toxin-like protein
MAQPLLKGQTAKCTSGGEKMFTQNAKFKLNQCPVRHMFGRSFLSILTVTFLLLGGLTAVQAGPILVTDEAKVEASSFDGQGTLNPPVISEATDVSAFSDTVTSFDDLTNGRSAGAEGTQNTTIDFTSTTINFGIIETSGGAVANWGDDDPGDGRDPRGEAKSEFTVTFDVDQNTSFALSGSIDTAADNSNESCSSVTVTSPTGATFNVSDGPGCGSSGQSINESGTLAPGRYTFSIAAHAIAENPNTTGGDAQASFELILVLGCTIVGTPGDDNLDGTNGDDIICGLGGFNFMKGHDGVDHIIGGSDTDLVTGGAFVDFIYGGGGNDLLIGAEGDDFIDGGEGADTIVGHLGNDFLVGGPGDEADDIYGDDIENCARRTSAPGLNDDEIFGGGGNDTLHGCEGLDKIHGEAGDDRIDGDKDDDVLLGGPGSDKLRGKKGNDTLEGDDPGEPNPRKDVLSGGAGDDILRARDGVKDSVKGGAGNNDQAETDSNDTVRDVEVFLP